MIGHDEIDGKELIVEAEKYSQSLLNFFYRQGVSFCEAQDLVQETFLRLWKYRREYVKTAKLTTFLFIIARQVRLDALRRETRRFIREERWSKERSWISESPEHCQSDDVRWAVQHLPEALRDVIELGVYQDLPYAEISEILSIPVGTVKSRMFNALKKLKEIFDDEGPEKSTR